MHASKHTGTPGSTPSSVANAINKTVMRARNSEAAFLAQKQQQKQHQQQQQQQQQHLQQQQKQQQAQQQFLL